MTDQSKWPRKNPPVASLHLDARNPRLRTAHTGTSPRDLIQRLFDHEDALGVAESIATRGYFPTEPLLAVEEDGQLVVVEGNRRLAALKGLREPTLLKPVHRRALERLRQRIQNPESLKSVPIVVAPSRRASDRLVVGRHSATAVKMWQAENRASFIIDKLENGYTTAQLEAELGLSAADITAARQTRAITEMARSLDVEDVVKAKIDAPRTKMFSTLERIFDSAPGREFLRIERSADHGVLIKASRDDFRRALRRIVEDIGYGHQDSRSLNTAENIRDYFASWEPGARPGASSRSLTPRDVTGENSVASSVTPAPSAPTQRNASPRKSVVPASLRVAEGPEKLKQLRKELTKLGREAYPSCGAVMLRVFLEMATLHYLEATGQLEPLKVRLKAERNLYFDQPTFSQMSPLLRDLVKRHFKGNEQSRILRALKYDKNQPFTIATLNGFVHDLREMPTAHEVLVFWEQIDPLMRLLLGRHEAP